MALTGEPGGPCRVAPGDQAGGMQAAGDALSALSQRGGGPPLALDWPALLGERAAISGFRRGGRVSCGGGTRLVQAADGWVAVALVRDSDLDAVPAWLGVPGTWRAVEAAIAAHPAADVVERGQLLGLAVAPVPADPPPRAELAMERVQNCTRSIASSGTRGVAGRLVVDLSSLWAGPLCTHLLGLAGARVVKVESPRRLDGARRGPAAFFDLLHAGKESVCIELDSPAFHDLVAAADLVVDSSRARAWDNLGIDRDANGPWISITGYGTAHREWVAFGDDAAAAAGITTLVGDPGSPLFCADAYADPVTGVHAAVVAFEAILDGGRGLIEIAMRDVVASMLHGAERHEVPAPGSVVVARPRARQPQGRAARAGADTEAVFRSLGLPVPSPS
jgi:hypothetical protein